MNRIARTLGLLAMLALTFGHAHAQDNRQTSLTELLQLVEQGLVQDASVQRERIEQFIAQRDQQEQRLQERRDRLTALENQTEVLETRFDENETAIAELEQRLEERLGTLKELFGVLQQNAGDFRNVVQSSPTSSQYEGRLAFLDGLIDKAGSSSRLPGISELEQLWFEMQREMIASGEIAAYDSQVVAENGEQTTMPVLRVGTFNVVNSDNGRYLNWDSSRTQLVELPRQPGDRYTSTASEFAEAAPGEIANFWVDPSGGSLLSLLIQSPELKDRIEQGGIVGYIILGLGAFALLLALERLISLGVVGLKVSRQARSEQPDAGNPLGRVMQAFESNKDKDLETLELKLGESIARETPKLTRFLPLLKIIAVVAPLLGLLGTVTGMINTFQAITLFGTGDPKLMAGGISQALVTTVMGLTVAIPTVLLHTLVNGRSKRLLQILEERSIGIIARRQEQAGDPKPKRSRRTAPVPEPA